MIQHNMNDFIDEHGNLDCQKFKEIISEMIVRVSRNIGKPISINQIEFVDRGIPHERPSELPTGKRGVYMFYCPEEKCFLKIGKVGLKSKARFCSQHYTFSSRSCLAKSLFNDKDVNYKFGKEDVGEWIMKHCHRIDILIDADLGPFANELIEACLHYRFNPKYEG